MNARLSKCTNGSGGSLRFVILRSDQKCRLLSLSSGVLKIKLRAIPQRRSRQAASTPARARLFARVCPASDEGRSGSGSARRTLLRTSAFQTASPIDSRRAHCEATRCSTPRVGSHHPSSGVSLEPGRAARDHPAKMSTNSFHASAGARLESSTPRMDNPFTSGEEEVRRDGARR